MAERSRAGYDRHDIRNGQEVRPAHGHGSGRSCKGRTMTTAPCSRRLAVLVLCGWWMISGPPRPALGQDRSAFPDFTGDRVYLKDVPGSYESLNQAIKSLEKSSPQTYYVAVIKSAGPGTDAAT